MPKPLSYEALFAALTVVGAAACSKAAPSAATAEPAPVASAVGAATPAPAAPTAAPAVAEEKEKADKDTLAAPAPATAAPSAKAIGATEQKKSAPRAINKPKGNAACGAGACGEDMKK